MPDFPAVTHVALTVSDLDRSVPWYARLFGADPVLDEDTGPFRHVVWSLGGTLVGLHQFPDGRDERFDERRHGLDHLAFGCANRGELETWEGRLDELGIAHGGIVDAVAELRGDALEVSLRRPLRGVAPGQTLVLYRPDPAGDEVLASATIRTAR